jgi:hypothetical protein
MGVRMTAQVKSVCFTVDGEWLADFARTRVIEGRWDAAIKLLETLHTEDAGITLDQIVMILKGDATLDGDSNVGIGFKKANIKAHKKQMGYMFGGVWNNAGRYIPACRYPVRGISEFPAPAGRRLFEDERAGCSR